MKRDINCNFGLAIVLFTFLLAKTNYEQLCKTCEQIPTP